MGQKGETGETGLTGETGKPGNDGVNGTKGNKVGFMQKNNVVVCLFVYLFTSLIVARSIVWSVGLAYGGAVLCDI